MLVPYFGSRVASEVNLLVIPTYQTSVHLSEQCQSLQTRFLSDESKPKIHSRNTPDALQTLKGILRSRLSTTLKSSTLKCKQRVPRHERFQSTAPLRPQLPMKYSSLLGLSFTYCDLGSTSLCLSTSSAGTVLSFTVKNQQSMRK